MTASFKYWLLAYFLLICCILNPQDSTKENALGGHFSRQGRIFGPAEKELLMKRGQFPFVVMVQIVLGPQKERICTGSIPSKKAVLTSSVCLDDHLSVGFWAGNVRYIYKEDFDPPTQGRELDSYKVSSELIGNTTMAYAITTREWIFTDQVSAIGLYLKEQKLVAEWRANCTVLGFGVASPVVDDSRIGRFMVQEVWTRIACFDMPPHSAHLCAFKDAHNKTTCAGDLGGPLLCHHDSHKLQQFGIVDGRMSKWSRFMDLDCIVPVREDRYLFLGFFRHFLKEIPQLPTEEIYFTPAEPTRKITKKDSGAPGLTVSGLLLICAIVTSSTLATVVTAQRPPCE